MLVRLDPNEEANEEAGKSESVQADSNETVPISTKTAEVPIPDNQEPLDDLGGRPRREKRPKKIRPYEGLTGAVGVLHEDIIGDKFWEERIWLLA